MRYGNTRIPNKEFKILIDRATNDVYKNLFRKGVCSAQDIEDIRQEAITVCLELWVKKNNPPLPAYLYNTLYWKCFSAFTGNSREGLRVYLISHPDIIANMDAMEDPENPELIYEEKMETERSDRLREELRELEITPDSPPGIVFALWWIGIPQKEIAMILLSAGLGPITQGGVCQHLRRVFDNIERQTGVSREMLRDLRKAGLSRD